MKILTKKHLRKNIPTTGDIYIRRCYVYRVMAYNETDDTILLCTTNDEIIHPGNIKRVELRKYGYHFCPFELRGPAIQVFELDNDLSLDSLNSLKHYRLRHLKLYEKLGLPSLLKYVQKTRDYTVPEQQGNEFPNLKGMTFKIPVPFFCIEKTDYMQTHASCCPTTRQRLAKKCKWPIFYVPGCFGE